MGQLQIFPSDGIAVVNPLIKDANFLHRIFCCGMPKFNLMHWFGFAHYAGGSLNHKFCAAFSNITKNSVASS